MDRMAPQGLLAQKKVVVITSRGAAYEKGTAREAFDFQEPYLLHVLAYIGLTDVTPDSRRESGL
jgi:FMN-dependent NADH-azoreductase